MSWRLTILHCIVAVIAVVVAVRLHDRAPTPTHGAAMPLLDPDELPVEGVRRVRIHRPPLSTLIVERRGGAWVETRPFDIPVNPFQVRETILAARQLRATRRIDAAQLEADGTSLESLSLSPPLATVTFVTDAGGEVALRLGRLGVAGRAFVQVGDDDAVLVVGQELHQRVLGDSLRAWRERTLFPEASIDALEIALRAGEARTELVRGGRAWTLRAPIETRADAAAVNGLIQSLARAECEGFVAENPDDLSPFGLHAPVGSATMRWRSPGQTEVATRTLLIGGPLAAGGADRYAMFEDRPLVMRLSGATLTSIFPAAAALIEPTAASGQPSDVGAIEIAAGDDDAVPRRFERTPLGWRDVENDAVASTTRVRQIDALLDQLLVARASAIALQDYPEALHLSTATLIGFDGVTLANVRIAVDESTGQWAAGTGDGALRIYPISQLPDLTSPIGPSRGPSRGRGPSSRQDSPRAR